MQLTRSAPVALSRGSALALAHADATRRAAPPAAARHEPPAGDLDAAAPAFRVDWAQCAADVNEAQRLRFKVFAGELGARLPVHGGARDVRDVDPFDQHCDHLLVRATGDAQRGKVVATCRVLSPGGARCAGGRYADTEFDLAPVRDLLPRSLEMGRVCVDPLWRNGLVVMAMWRELGKRMNDERLDTLIGCSSISLCDGGDAAEQLWHRLKRTHLVAPERRVRPWVALALQAQDQALPVPTPAPVPALMKAYLRCGGKLLGPPALDAAFNTADFPMLMHLGDLPSRYGKRIFGACE